LSNHPAAPEDEPLVTRLVTMKQNLLVAFLALAVLALAVGGWVVQGVRPRPRPLFA
jgi:hypothetical protein